MKRFKISIIILTLALLVSTCLSFTAAAEPATGKQPTGVVMTYYDGIYSRGFAWQTDETVTESKLLLAKRSNGRADWGNAREIDGSFVDFQGYRCHKAQVTELEAGAEYSYKVGGDGVYSQEGSFKVEDNAQAGTSFVYVTDSQETSVEGFEQWKKTLETATNTITPDFIAFAGDLVDNSHAGWGSDFTKIQMQEWSYAFDVPKDIIMNVPFMSVAGNHERAGSTYVNHSNISFAGQNASGGYYSFDYGDVHFVGLNSNDASSESSFAKQIEWLKADLAETSANFKVVMLHIGAYSTGDHSNDSDAIYIRSILPQIMAEYEVDLVLQGHDHVYTRTKPYYYGEGENGRVPNRDELLVPYKKGEESFLQSQEPDGTYYVTINYAGTKSYPPVEYDTSRIFPAESPVNGKLMSQEIRNRMFATVEINGDELLFCAYIAKDDGSAELYDYFAIRKNTYERAAEIIDSLPDGQPLTARNAPAMAEAKAEVEKLSHRGLKRLGEDRQNKLSAGLSAINLTDALAAYEAMSAIDKLDPEVMDESFHQNYAMANNLYFSLSEPQKELVDNAALLENMEQTITEQLAVAEVQKLIDSIKTAENAEEARNIAKQAYELLSDEAKAGITGAEQLEKSEKGCGSNAGVQSGVAVLLLIAAALVILRTRRIGHENS